MTTRGYRRFSLVGLAAVCLAAVLVIAEARAAEQGTTMADARAALDEGRCEAAVDMVNKGLAAGDPKAFSMVGLMYVRGACLKAAPDKAPAYLEPAAKAGDTDAARLLVMQHGFGLGVQQSYAEAGRWMIAWMDILEIDRTGEVSDGRAGTGARAKISRDTAEAFGVLGAVAAAVQERAVQIHTQTPNAAIQMTLRLELAPDGLRFDIMNAKGGRDPAINGSSQRPLSADAQVGYMRDVVEGAIKDLPAFALPSVRQELIIPYSFRLRRPLVNPVR